MHYQLLNPTDLIKYDINNTDFGADTGRIIERHDLSTNNSAPFDIRANLYRRWDDGSGLFTVLSDNGNADQDFAAIDLSQCTNCNIAIEPNYQGNTTIQGSCNDVSIGISGLGITILDGTSSATIESGAKNYLNQRKL